MRERVRRARDGVDELFAPIGLERFIAEHWDRAPRVFRGRRDGFMRLVGVDFDADEFMRAATAATSAPHGHVDIFASLRHDRFLAKRAPVRPYVKLAPDDVDAAFSAGASIQINGIENLANSPEAARITAFAEAIRTKLHLAASLGVAATLSPKGARFDPHLDPAPALFLQTAGTKRVRFGAAPLVPRPRAKGFVFDDGRLRYASDLRAERTTEAWERARTDAASLRSAVLHPGDFVYLPAGTVHATEALSRESVSLLFIYAPLTFRDVLDRLVEERFASHAEWRGMPAWLDAGDGALPPPIADFVAARVGELRSLVASLDPAGLDLHRAVCRTIADSRFAGLGRASLRRERAPLDRTTRLRVRGAPSFAIGGEGDARAGHLFVAGAELSFAGPWIDFVRSVLREGSFVAEAALAWLPRGARKWKEAKECFDALIQHGVLDVEDPSTPRPP